MLYGKDKEDETAVLTEAEAIRKEELARELLNVLLKVYPGKSVLWPHSECPWITSNRSLSEMLKQ